MGRILYVIYIVLIFTPLFAIITILTAVVAAVGSIIGLERFATMYPGMVWSKLTIILSLCRITIEGRENIPTDKYCVIACNHQSAFDIWALYGYTHIPFKWVLKGSLSRVPFVGWACRKCGFIFVDNSSPERAANVVYMANQVLKNEYHVMIFPEGTRSPDGRLGKFKKGAFKIAMDTGAPVIPISISGAYQILSKDDIIPKRGHIRLKIHPQIDSTQYPQDVRGLLALSADTRAAIESGIVP
ncbi:lysophospholipid acyltransferase family protein [Porphyromonas cangingivalis]|uniref:1-acyl-sn-glycerol-3-phosphate acyltransferase n=2 Tax=Porphyromonas cangingivalis TaxID=36874 RepID=A0A099WYZ2_PORCN|nr:lysophospholipid acyltransferase family protein [Porphyromonas cangingivalis]KGL49405.1 hypothetical protein HQ34_04560 [Porphyromonas cangingivalis]KGN78602.1 hypothetical protein HQ35_09435 [Porphyromonas cangingivalis]SJZ41252.1 1-acyl-sn-glycerol-3-phosphate acyltransferase [Porphyromonas cangingivalis]VEJ02716.1 1-acyl-sn-glycerol-3-phosphate acyltransferase [Porphyromonas cangingivalis]